MPTVYAFEGLHLDSQIPASSNRTHLDHRASIVSRLETARKGDARGIGPSSSARVSFVHPKVDRQSSPHHPHADRTPYTEHEQNMPGKKGRGNNNAVKGTGKDATTTNAGPAGPPAALPASSQAKSQTPAPSATATSTTRQAVMQNQNPAEDFWTKNSHAKALIMSTLVPGTEPYKIAESHELATDIWKELQAKYAPAKKFLSSGKGQIAADSLQASRDFIGDWVEGKPLDKYIDMYNRDMARANDQQKPQTQAAPTGQQTQQNRTAPPVGGHGHGHEDAQARTKQEEEDALSTSVEPSQQPQPQPSGLAPRDKDPAAAHWKPSPVKHDSYLSEYQALAFAGGDVQRKRQIQLAATKVLMQKLPTRDLRFLWAVMYGGDKTPWPGSLSVVIPGVTMVARRFEDGNG
ncbi:hypothetical protein LTR99_005903 [Exophiala xenobiotica]|uniref:Uncharacterized protein n=1 Tax=Vermiconidia calcicola TaxID=1690605 RepID=A0AAV9QDT6_9PEZI|nr:hypothetical protein H2202_000223 [Exophiala xenobiotica]KAK5541023.1 hypothetical protein LTR25_002800 [Vermiconidia calcicola]KAK5549484.1 hypothetical protein LTR23_000592 [Chaetothyriales sp. CCFEE 6169]KAK5193866.1 hypothetical protein LTR92_006206 [Exophiala xenobiotica]KAK5208106.1 hypothetical protein LTR41_006042 [Exophiala xenobiotica]